MKSIEEVKASLIASVGSDPKKAAANLVVTMALAGKLTSGMPDSAVESLVMSIVETFLEAFKGAVQQEVFEQQKAASDKLEKTLGGK